VRAARAAAALCSAVALLGVVPARAGGFLGIDHRWAYDDSGISRRSNQLILMDSLIGGEVLFSATIRTPGSRVARTTAFPAAKWRPSARSLHLASLGLCV